jgi:hypothetical protein
MTKRNLADIDLKALRKVFYRVMPIEQPLVNVGMDWAQSSAARRRQRIGLPKWVLWLAVVLALINVGAFPLCAQPHDAAAVPAFDVVYVKRIGPRSNKGNYLLR